MQFIHRLFTVIIFVSMIFTANFSYAGEAGTLDTSFDSGGIVTTDNNGHDVARGVAIQSDGKIVIAGTTEDLSGTPKFIVCRYNEDGSLDTTFDTDGIVVTDVGGDSVSANVVAIQADGKIVVAGTSGDYGNTSIAVVRYTTNGALDTTFALDGITTLQLTPDTFNWSEDMVIQSDGKIIVAGVTIFGDYNFGVVRFTTAGILDTTFGGDGMKIIDFGNWDFCHAVALQADGKIVLGGRSKVNSTYDFALARLTRSGALDTTFNTDGKVTMDLSSGNYDVISSLVVQSDGKILAGGQSYGNRLAIARFTDAGGLDGTFGTNGVVESSSINEAHSIILQSNSTIVATGNAPPNFGIARFTPLGSLDMSFSSDGILIQSIGVNSDAAWDAALQSDGKIVAVGESDNGTDIDIAIIRVISGVTGDFVGDINNDNSVDLVDAILALQEISGTNTGISFNLAKEVDGDVKIGLPETIFAIRVVAGIDNDGDGNLVESGDCNDTDNSIYLGAAEVCGDGIDQNCDGSDLDCSDVPTVYNPTTNRFWMDRNLGASQVATSYNDPEAYGDLYQWGRGTDGHEKRISGTVSALSSSDTPGHDNFILVPLTPPFDWRNPQNDNLWQGVAGMNNPCPSGFRLPTEEEWVIEHDSWQTNDAAGAFASPLKLALAGGRDPIDGDGGQVVDEGSKGTYGSSTRSGMTTTVITFDINGAEFLSNSIRANGYSIRCIKD